ncbi:hypothetical protein BDV38DRAFT_281911 [Aspergillus pseudotamarii]|uniref:Uncharacterized protein n=1 Tax=Aspergillus pseudotamarii TaxID=132259 RepID=A0A5N6SVA1_ASPPS|nr:uncharacterized protein BDV38DRAFT_281911 [Aspergillus pseudotamarii]KAE8138608.1 hypothetical protein BDV38DRAFT_281911 [Aspergillus pseudotamarii]
MTAYIPPPGIADYAASKAGLIAFHEERPISPSSFLPLLHVTVVDAIVDTLDSGLSQTIFLPGIFRLLAGLRGALDWAQNLIRGGTKSLKVEFKGHQKIDPQTGKRVA